MLIDLMIFEAAAPSNWPAARALRFFITKPISLGPILAKPNSAAMESMRFLSSASPSRAFR